MQVIHAELLDETQSTVKFIMNDNAILFFSAAQQHRDIKSHGLSYEDDYRGNAVAGLVMPGRIEIRFHQAYSDERIRSLWACVSPLPELVKIRVKKVYYQGREI